MWPQPLKEVMTLATVTALAGGAALLWLAAAATRRGLQRRRRTMRTRSTTCGITRLMVSNLFGRELELLITARVAFGERGLPQPAALDTFLTALCDHTRFRSIPTQSAQGGPVTWIPQPLRLGHHIIRRTVVGGRAELRAEEQAFINAPLRDKSVPWWEVLLLDAPGEGEAILLLKIHHAIGDGLSLAEALMALVTDEASRPVADRGIFSPRGRSTQLRQTFDAAPALLAPLLRWLRAAVWVPLTFIGNFIYVLSIPVAFFDGPNILRDPNATTFPPRRQQVPVIFPSHSLQLVKDIRMAIDPSGAVTVNDVEFAVLAGAVRRCLARTGAGDAQLNGARIRCLTPVGFPEQPCEVSRFHTLLRNNFVSIATRLPVAEATPRERIAASHAAWHRVKTSTILAAYVAVLRMVSACFPLWYKQQLARDMQRATSMLYSNVPGPQCRCFLAGVEVQTAHIFCPNLNPYVGALSINGRIHTAGSFYAELSDGAAAPIPPEDVAAAFREELSFMANDVLGLSAEELLMRKLVDAP